VLAFTSVYFFEMSLFNGLQAIQIKNSGFVPSPARPSPTQPIQSPREAPGGKADSQIALRSLAAVHLNYIARISVFAKTLRGS
jgi:hypothetical protein